MAKCLFTIYMLDIDIDKNFHSKVEEIVNKFNKNVEYDHEKYYPKKSANEDTQKVYIRSAKTTPVWNSVLNELTSDSTDLENVNHSYVLFYLIKDIVFAVTGGGGHHLIDSVKKFNFGLHLINRVIGANDNFIKKVNDKRIIGNKIAGEAQYINSVNVYSEQDTNNLFKELELELPSSIIKEKLGIDIKINKETYRFFAKDSIKLSKQITTEELNTLLLSVHHLMQNEPIYSIIPIYEVNKKDRIWKQLNFKLAAQFISYLYKQNTEAHFQILPFRATYDKSQVKLEKNKNQFRNYTTVHDLISSLKEKVIQNEAPMVILQQLNDIKLIGYLEDSVVENNPLYNHLDVIVTHEDTNYWLSDGTWYGIEKDFIKQLNKSFTEKITEKEFFNFKHNSMKQWLTGSEGDYNDSHYTIDNVHVLDRVLVNNIEMCDLLIEENNQLYFVHVKDGLDGEVRILCDQILHAMALLSNAITNDGDELKIIYQVMSNRSINDKIVTSSKNSAKKFIDTFPTEQTFIDYVKSFIGKISFVFAFRPKQSHKLNKPSTITSTSAKISMIDLIQLKNNYNFNLEFLNIKAIQAN